MNLRKKHIGLFVIAGFIGAYWAAAQMLPGFIARQQGAEIVRAQPSFMPCMTGGSLAFDMRLDESRHQWVVDMLQGDRVVHMARDADLESAELFNWCHNQEGNQLNTAYLSRQVVQREGNKEQQLKWVTYREGARQVKTFPLPYSGERGSYRVVDWNDEWVLLDQWMPEHAESQNGIGLLNLRSGQYTVPVPGQPGRVFGAVLAAGGFVYIAGEDLYYHDLGTHAQRKIGKRGWYLFAAQGTAVAWTPHGWPHQVVVHDLKTDQEWKLDGTYPFLVGDKVIRTVPIGAARFGEEPSGAEIVVSNRDGSQRRVLARIANYDTHAVYYNGKLYYVDEISNLQYPFELAYNLVSKGLLYASLTPGTTKYLFAKDVDLNQP